MDLRKTFHTTLCDELSREEAQRLKVQCVREGQEQFLDAGRLQFCQTATDGIGSADQCASQHLTSYQAGGNLRQGLLYGIADGADGS